MMREKGALLMKEKNARQRGSIIVYILIAIFLTGLLVSLMSQGAKKSASSEQIDEVMMYLQADIQTVQSNITECVTSYQNNNFCPPNASGNGVSCVNQFTTQDTGNPNVPFPMPASSSGGTVGTPLASIQCPRAPSGQQTIFNGGVIQSLKLLQDTANYTTTYFNGNSSVPASGNAVTGVYEGVYLRIERTVSDPVWTEAIQRMNSKYAACSVSYVLPGSQDPTGYTCPNGCLYYWILRLSTSSTSWEHNSSVASCP